MRFSAPVEPLIITSGYGPRPKPSGPLHPGLDFHCTHGQAVRAVDDGPVVRAYFSANWRRVPVWGPEVGPDGKPVQLVVNGTPQFTFVEYAWRPDDPLPDKFGYGETVVVQHADGRTTRYAHLSKRLVKEGEHVSQGQVIGQAGTTGYSWGVHLHFELRAAGGRGLIDPTPEFAPLNPQYI